MQVMAFMLQLEIGAAAKRCPVPARLMDVGTATHLPGSITTTLPGLPPA